MTLEMCIRDRYRDIAHPITAEARDEIQTVVLAEFEKQSGDPEAVVH